MRCTGDRHEAETETVGAVKYREIGRQPARAYVLTDIRLRTEIRRLMTIDA